jgi:hypothetical protein
MKRAYVLMLIICSGAFGATARGGSYSIPDENLDLTRVYWGDYKEFTKAAEIRYEDVIRSTPEYDEIKKKKIARDTGKYWILLSQASDRAIKAIATIGGETDYDFVTANGYLEALEPPIPVDDITADVVAKIEETVIAEQGDGGRTRHAAK